MDRDAGRVKKNDKKYRKTIVFLDCGLQNCKKILFWSNKYSIENKTIKDYLNFLFSFW